MYKNNHVLLQTMKIKDNKLLQLVLADSVLVYQVWGDFYEEKVMNWCKSELWKKSS